MTPKSPFQKASKSRAWSAVTSIVAALVLAPVATGGHPAVKIVDLIWEYMGGKETYEKVRYIEFTWASESQDGTGSSRTHLWDRYRGDYVLEFTDSKANDRIEIYFNVDTKKGVALKNGVELSGKEKAEFIDRAYRIFVNDTYWLLAPTKLQDPGARLVYDGHTGTATEEHGEREFVVLHLYFDEGTGITPGDEYWFYVRHSGQVARWRYVLEDGHEGDWLWTEEGDCGMGITLPMRRVSADGKRAIFFPHVEFHETMDRSRFEYAGEKGG